MRNINAVLTINVFCYYRVVWVLTGSGPKPQNGRFKGF